jgi:ABC-type multidrug transport system ATPase subunit
VTVKNEGRRKAILRQVGIEIQAGEFIGILGGSGQGKSTLMNVLGGLLSPSKGGVLIDGEPLGASLLAGSVIGFVPQDDIVHTELTVTQALTLTARLRLAVSGQAIQTLVSGIILKLGLKDHAEKPVRILSGGQRKRVNIATELLVRPAVLFLDEPTSGLDPDNEESVVATLQNLSLTGQTVVSTTHSLHKAFLFNRVAFVHDGRLLFLGNLEEAREHFLTADKDATGTATSTDTSSPAFRLERIYKKVNEEKDSEKWLARFLKSPLAPFSAHAFPPRRRVFARPPRPSRPGFFSTMVVLAQTQWAILAADPKNIRSLFLQAVGIGLLSGWVGREDPEFRYFACLIATLWFGCSNAAQTIVRELPIFRRERIAGLSLPPYILSKSLFLACIAWIQVLLLLASQAVPVLLAGSGGDAVPAHDLLPPGSRWFLAMAFGLMGLVGVQIGLALSSMARTATQASLWVPLALIPQILFSGFVVTRPDMPDSARLFSFLVPSASAQHLIDLANIHQKAVPVMTDDTEVPMFFATDDTLRPRRTPGIHQSASGAPKRYRELDEYNTSWQNSVVDCSQLGNHAPNADDEANRKDYVRRRDDIFPPLEAGKDFDAGAQVSSAVISLGIWSLTCYAITWLGLALAQPAPLRPGWLRDRS